MKMKMFVLICSILCLSFGLVGCGDDDESFEEIQRSLIANTWIWERVVRTTFIDNSPVAIEEQPLDNSDFEIEFNEGGQFIIRNDGGELTGRWEFIDDTDVIMIWDDSSLPDARFTILKLTQDEFWVLTTAEIGGEVIETEARHIPKPL